MQTIAIQTIKTYLNDTYLFVDYGKVIHTGIDDKGYFLILDKTIFYPQGGGQPSDQGHLEIDGVSFDIYDVRIVDNQIRHYSAQDCKELLGKNTKLIIDQEKRLLHAKLHTSGHLLSNIVEKEYTQDKGTQYKAVKGHHFPGECYVEFSGNDQLAQELDLDLLNNIVNDYIKQDLKLESFYIAGDELSGYCPNLPYSIPKTERVRLIKMSPFDYQPCGGTHVKSSLELQGLYFTKQKLKGNNLKISYQII